MGCLLETFLTISTYNMLMRATEQWLEEKLAEYQKDPVATLKDLLEASTEVIDQYTQSPGKATSGVLIACMDHTKLFLDKINEQSRR